MNLCARRFGFIVLAIGVLAAVVVLAAPAAVRGDTQREPGKDDAREVTREEVLQLLAYNRGLDLTADEQKVFHQVLSRIPAPCCSSFPAETCCCECNLTRAVWGLTKHLIKDESAAAAEVEAEVRRWLAASNPSGYTGDACFKGGCGRPFLRNGCGGMDEAKLVF